MLNIHDFTNWYLEMNPTKDEAFVKCNYFGTAQRSFYEEVNSYANQMLGIKNTRGCCEGCNYKCYTCGEIEEIKNKINSFYLAHVGRQNGTLDETLKGELYNLLVGYVDLAVR